MSVFDAHFHIIDSRFPLVSNHGFLPDDFDVEQYLERVSLLNIKSGVVVSGSFQAFDQSYLLSALALLNSRSNNFVGVTQVPHDISDGELLKLDAAGVRGVRFNLFRGGSERVGYLCYFAQRVYDLCGWHIELYISSEGLYHLQDLIKNLPKVCIDHMGMEKSSFPVVDDLLRHGVYVKVCGFGRVDFDPIKRLQEMVLINPNALMFGTDLPSTRALRPFRNEDLSLIKGIFSSDSYQNITWHNGRRFYRLDTD
ncbi:MULTISPECIES: amidohydrolase family protein [unclassified Oleiphilus]|nr:MULTISPECIES: amidohydrolase family protein [unclassified Oleiphilus]KZY46837.1 2-pyrone-4,6-dicarboxylate hydrolase [Oleiphilus sp. HI0050]KZY80963.1 2-pyrone-4,6-dicarboxylate hydrolase [Oleiphilus sp. HI0069]KZY88669.1 2-pyrone-4,6-dicarboxylate hydrolase [Oleiphilus sp. HI0072]KZZ11862.1 2-pyrone-4,6-dicarboxylate hydrolase [Oleiphilus sp. HI0078]KZY36428.1 2-pyrone-4,6-dicarboxylate hydrolase [Oleiphilus sp. HI0043]